MADAIKTNREERENDRSVTGFSLMEPVGKVHASWKNFRSYLHDVRVEMRHVNWPSRLDVWSTTIVVTVTVAFFGVYFWITDMVFSRLYVIVNGYFRHN
jgi:preprotein translocase SecE subunit